MSLLTIAHVVAGGVALGSGLAALAAPKDGRWHRRAGATYFWAMGVITCSAVILCALHANLFVGLAAIFSFYFPFAGFRIWTRSRHGSQARATAVDWAGIGILLAVSIGFLMIWERGLGPGPFGSLMSCLFGLLGGGVALPEAARLSGGRVFGGPAPLPFAHGGLMVSAFAATILGFYAAFLPALWVWPIAVVTPYALAAVWSWSHDVGRAVPPARQ